MNVKEAVARAKQYVKDLFGEEGISNVGLEEVDFDGTCWSVTIGFSRPWNQGVGGGLASLVSAVSRDYKIVKVEDDTGEILSVKSKIIPK